MTYIAIASNLTAVYWWIVRNLSIADLPRGKKESQR